MLVLFSTNYYALFTILLCTIYNFKSKMEKNAEVYKFLKGEMI